MPRRYDWLPRTDLDGLFIVIALIVGLSGVILSLTGAGDRDGTSNPSPRGGRPGTGGSVELQPPELVRAGSSR